MLMLTFVMKACLIERNSSFASELLLLLGFSRSRLCLEYEWYFCGNMKYLVLWTANSLYLLFTNVLFVCGYTRYVVHWTPSFLFIFCACVIYVFLRSCPVHDVVNSNCGKNIYVRNDVLFFSGMTVMLNYLDLMV